MRRIYFSPDGKSFSEVMAYVLSLFFLILIVADSQMRSDLWWPIAARKFESSYLEIPIDILLALFVFYVPFCALGVLAGPASGLPNIKENRQDLEFIILVINFISGLALALHFYESGGALYQRLLTAINIIIILYEARLLMNEDTAGEDTSSGEMGAKHVLCCVLFTIIFYVVSRQGTELYWAESLSMACTAAALFGMLLSRLLPLYPLGSRLKGANSEMLNAYLGKAKKELAEEMAARKSDIH